MMLGKGISGNCFVCGGERNANGNEEDCILNLYKRPSYNLKWGDGA
jgi:hypothetical protein